MFDISIIIFAASLIGIIILFVVQAGRIGDEEYASKDLSYENFHKLRKRIFEFWQLIIHSLAIILSKSWARVTHFVWGIFHKGAKHIDNQLMKHEKRKSDGEVKQSVFITTVKAYKHEIKKLKGRVEDEKPRARNEVENAGVDLSPEDNKIE